MLSNIIYFGIISNYLFDKYLTIRQFLKLNNTKYEGNVTKLIESSEFIKMKQYNSMKLIFTFFVSTFSFIKTFAIFHLNLMPFFYQKLLTFTKFTDNSNFEIFFIFLFVCVDRIISIPFEMYSIFVIEAKYEFNNMTIGLYFKDFIKGLLLSIIIGAPIMKGTFSIIYSYYHSFWIYLSVFVTFIMIVTIICIPTIIQPLFNKFTELEDSELKTKINELAKKVHFRCNKILQIDGSKRSHHSNAYFIGLFKEKRIVLFDTLFKQVSDNEIVGILAHELGHWFHNHMYKMLFVQVLINNCHFYFLEKFLCYNFEFLNMKSVPLVLKTYYFQLFCNNFAYLLIFCGNYFSRKNERQADLYAIKLGYGEDLKTGLVALHKKNLSNIIPDSLYSMLYHSHPTLIERMEFIDKNMKKKEE